MINLIETTERFFAKSSAWRMVRLLSENSGGQQHSGVPDFFGSRLRNDQISDEVYEEIEKLPPIIPLLLALRL